MKIIVILAVSLAASAVSRPSFAGGLGDNNYSCTDSRNCVVVTESGAGAAMVVSRSAAGGETVVANSAGGYAIHGNTTGTGSAVIGTNWTAGGFAGNFEGNILVQETPYAYQDTFTHWSDERLKKNIKPLEGALDTVLKLRGVTFEWKDPDKAARQTGVQKGFIAQDVEKVVPEWVSVAPDGYKAVNLSGLNAMLVESIRSLKVENDKARLENDDLRTRSALLEGRVKVLEAGRHPLVSGFGEGGIGLGLCAIAGALVLTRRRRSDESTPAAGQPR